MESTLLLRMLLFTAGSLSLLMTILVGRRGWLVNAPHVLLLAGVSAACLALFFLRSQSPLPVAMALSASVLFNVVPLLLAGVTRRFVRTDRFREAANLLFIRFPLTPSPASLLEIRILQAFDAAGREGFEAARKIFDALETSFGFQRLHHLVDEAFLDLCLKLFRWEEADDFLDRHPERMERSIVRQHRLLVFTLRVRCEAGRIADAARILERITEATPTKFSWGEMASAYMILLGCAGEEEKLVTLFREHGHLLESFPPPVLDLWLGRARAARGDAEGARHLFQSARHEAEKVSPNILGRIEKQMEAPPKPAAEGGLEIPWPPPIPADVRYVSPLAFSAPRQRMAAVTATLVLVLLAIWGAEELAGGSEDSYVLTAMGANVRFLIDAGQIWRLGASTLLHIGYLHLILNALGLIFLGRIVENIYGGARFLSIYVLAGFAGSAASHLFSDAQLSAGASGAIFGLVGAGTAFLVFHGARLPPRARRTYLFIFLFIAGADTILSLSLIVIDAHAHIGGLVVGFAGGALLTPRLGERRDFPSWRRIGARLFAFASAAALCGCMVVAVRQGFDGEPFPGDLRYKTHRDPRGAFSVPVPESFQPPRSDDGSARTGDGPARFVGRPTIEVIVESVPPHPGRTLEQRAFDYEESEVWKGFERRPVVGPAIWRAAGGGRTALVFSKKVGPHLECRSFYFEDGGFTARIAFLAPMRGLTVYESIMAEIVTGFRYTGGSRDE
ncbi:MAG: rhomboid family intramembrane serine protease [Planctomycetota bacterium]|jgi:rhomboid protease GluP